jgi:hypothetical protein
LLDSDAGFRCHLQGELVDLTNRSESLQAQHDLSVQRNAATDHSGISSLRNHGNCVLAADVDYPSNLTRCARANHGRRRTDIAARPIDNKTSRIITGYDMLVSNELPNGAQGNINSH